MSNAKPAAQWTIARLKDENRATLSDKYQTFILLFEGNRVGELKWRYRTKNAGGSAWCAKLFGVSVCNMDVCFWHYDRAKALVWAKQEYPSAIARRQRDLERDAIYAAIYAAEEAEAIPA